MWATGLAESCDFGEKACRRFLRFIKTWILRGALVAPSPAAPGSLALAQDDNFHLQV
jgi:hypothetical protein